MGLFFIPIYRNKFTLKPIAANRRHYYPGGMWYKDIYPFDNSYETGNISKTHIDMLDPKYPKICPHCHGNNGRMQKECRDLYCFTCGWRDSLYFDNKVNKFIKWVERREDLYGEPNLLTNEEIERKEKHNLESKLFKRAKRAKGEMPPVDKKRKNELSRQRRKILTQDPFYRKGCNEYQKEWRSKVRNKERINGYQREYRSRARNKETVMAGYCKEGKKDV